VWDQLGWNQERRAAWGQLDVMTHVGDGNRLTLHPDRPLVPRLLLSFPIPLSLSCKRKRPPGRVEAW
jgi:hypothetical protein